MRVTSDFWVSALLRRVFSEGGFAAIQRKGSYEAGAIFVIHRSRFGELELYGPAPQTSYDEKKPADRQFVRVAVGPDDEAVTARLEREKRFDPDIWIVEVETGAGVEGYLEIAAG